VNEKGNMIAKIGDCARGSQSAADFEEVFIEIWLTLG